MKIIDVFVCKLRKKLAAAGAGEIIGTVWGRGYTVRDQAARTDKAIAPRKPATPATRFASASALAY